MVYIWNTHVQIFEYWTIQGSSTSPMVTCTKNMFKVINIFICCNLMKQKPLLKAFYFQFLKINIWMLFNIEKSMDHPPLRWWNVPEQCFFFTNTFFIQPTCAACANKKPFAQSFHSTFAKTMYFVQYWKSDYHPPLPWWNVRTYNSFQKKQSNPFFQKWSKAMSKGFCLHHVAKYFYVFSKWSKGMS